MLRASLCVYVSQSKFNLLNLKNESVEKNTEMIMMVYGLLPIFPDNGCLQLLHYLLCVERLQDCCIGMTSWLQSVYVLLVLIPLHTICERLDFPF